MGRQCSPGRARGGPASQRREQSAARDPEYLRIACSGDPNGSCTTAHYKTATRAHIESLGYDIVANFGDQYSDLVGGYADRTFKLPNPNSSCRRRREAGSPARAPRPA